MTDVVPGPPPPRLPAPYGVLSEQLRQEQDTNLLLTEQLVEAAGSRLGESVTRLENMLADDIGWQRLVAQADWEFSRTGLRQIVAICRVMWLKNPLIRRGVNLSGHYVFGQGVTVSSEDERIQQVIDQITDDRSNRRHFWSADARADLERTSHTDGNVFVSLRTDKAGFIRLRTIDFDEVADVVYDPDDPGEPWFYLRTWTETTVDATTGARSQQSRSAWYPSVDHAGQVVPGRRPASFAGHQIRWDTPVIHVKVGAPRGWTFGIPTVYPAIDWARAYTRFLEDWLSYVKSLARFAWQHKAKGRRVDSVKAAHEATYDDNSRADGKRTPAGRTLVSTDDLQPITHTGAHVDADSGRPVVMMVASALEVPYGWLTGDPDRGNLATAKTLDRPTELAFSARQEVWGDVIRQVIIHAAHAAGITGDIPVEIEWPDLTEHSVLEVVEAIAKADETGKMPVEDVCRMLLQALGVDDVDAAVERFLDQVQAATDEQDAETAATEALAEALGQLQLAGIGDGQHD